MEKKPKLKRDWVHRRVRLLRKLETKGGVIFEKDEVMVVHRNFGGLELTTLTRCPKCERGHRHYIRKVHERDVELLPEE